MYVQTRIYAKVQNASWWYVQRVWSVLSLMCRECNDVMLQCDDVMLLSGMCRECGAYVQRVWSGTNSCICICIEREVCIYIHIHTHACMHACIHLHTHRYTRRECEEVSVCFSVKRGLLHGKIDLLQTKKRPTDTLTCVPSRLQGCA